MVGRVAGVSCFWYNHGSAATGGGLSPPGQPTRPIRRGPRDGCLGATSAEKEVTGLI
jgi:hypothetical protein